MKLTKSYSAILYTGFREEWSLCNVFNIFLKLCLITLFLPFLQEEEKLPLASLSSKFPGYSGDIQRKKTGMCFTLLYYLGQAGLFKKINSYWQNVMGVTNSLVFFRY